MPEVGSLTASPETTPIHGPPIRTHQLTATQDNRPSLVHSVEQLRVRVRDGGGLNGGPNNRDPYTRSGVLESLPWIYPKVSAMANLPRLSPSNYPGTV